jgi:hypothetical protein
MISSYPKPIWLRMIKMAAKPEPSCTRCPKARRPGVFDVAPDTARARHARFKPEYLTAVLQPASLAPVKILGPLDRATCKQLLGPHLPVLDSCFRAAWSGWQKWIGTYEGPPTDLSPRTRASVLYDFIAAEATKSFAGESGVLV